MKGNLLKELRKENKLTQEQLAQKLGVSKSTIGMVESGKQEGGRNLTFKVAEFFDVSIDFLEGKVTYRKDVSENKRKMVSEFLEMLVDNGIIDDPNNIPNDINDAILDMVKIELKAIKDKRRGE